MRTRTLSFGAVVLAFTLVAAIPQYGQNRPVASPDKDYARHTLAVSLLRAINMAELDHLLSHGSYLPWGELFTNGDFTEQGSKRVSNNPDLEAVHFSKGPEILPGWMLRLNVTNGGKGYDLLLEDTTDKSCGYAAVTDERGIIRQSKAIDCPI
jgi:hypothetical protein